MKSLWKICRRYILSGIFLAMMLLYLNFALFVYIGVTNMGKANGRDISRETMDAVVNALGQENGVRVMGEEGMRLLSESSFVWAMLLDESGAIAWSWELPPELNHRYSIGDAAALSRWYLNDYPVRVWRNGEELMVFGMDKDSVTRFSVIYDLAMVQNMPALLWQMLTANLILLLVLSLWLAYRFYRSMRPIARGLKQLPEKEHEPIPEKGIMGELAAKLNETARLLEWQEQKLTKRDAARTEWIAGVSHDIRTPLALIIGYADELSGNGMTEAQMQKRAQVIKEQSLIIRQLIADLNLTSKLEYQAQPLTLVTVSPAVLLRECVAEYYNQGLSGQYEFELSIDEASEPFKICGDVNLLLRAFRNLIGNSIRHNPDGCCIFVTAARCEDGICMTFADSGAGIPSRIVKALAQDCGEGEKNNERHASRAALMSTETAAVSTGQPPHIMGLRIVTQIIRAHGYKLLWKERAGGTYDVQIQMHEPQI